MRRALNLSLSLGLALAALVTPTWAQRRIDFSRYVVVGDSLSAPFINFSVSETNQVYSHANLFAKQAKTTLTLPLIAEPGIPSQLQLTTQPPFIAPTPGTSTGRLDPTVQATNLAVPGQTLANALYLRPEFPIQQSDLIKTLTNLLIGMPGLFQGVSRSQVEWAEQLHPTFSSVWIGNNDALFAVLIGNPYLVTPPSIFATQFAELTNRMVNTGAALAFANIPDVTSIPYLTPAERIVVPVALVLGQKPAEVYATLNVAPGDLLLPGGVQKIADMVAARNLVALPATCPVPLLNMPDGGGCLLRAADAALVQSVVDAYNGIIAQEAQRSGAALVDVNGFFKQIVANGGYELGDGRRLTTAPLGGLFSLDLVHPTRTGQALIANQLIKAVNAKFGTKIPQVDVKAIAKNDPLVFTYGMRLPLF